jgi:23S rRNA (cytosine1962-C5)-methyltransferase
MKTEGRLSPLSGGVISVERNRVKMVEKPVEVGAAVAQALAQRAALMRTLLAEGTDAFRLFHGAVEGAPGLTVDRYGSLMLVQSFRAPLAPAELNDLEEAVRATGMTLHTVYNHRGREGHADWHQPTAAAGMHHVAREMGLRFTIQGRHAGQDPWLFLDLRCGRRWMRAHAGDGDVLNLFAYTCGLGLAAAASGAKEVLNVDFAQTALDVGDTNARTNGLDGPSWHTVRADVLPTIRQLAGLPIKGRVRRRGRMPTTFAPFDARQFDLVVLDPPTFSRSPFGAVDLVRDYQSLFKPALLATKSGGRMLVTNHVSTVSEHDWHGALVRCAEKAGRPVVDLQVLRPESDFPSPDSRPPLKVAVITI